MEVQELDKECRALLGSLGGVSWTGSTPDLRAVLAGLEAEPAPWSPPFNFPVATIEGPLLPFLELDGADAGADQSASTLLQDSPSPCSTACFPGDAMSTVPADRLDLVPLASHQWVPHVPPTVQAHCSPSPASSTKGFEAFQLPLSAAQGLPSISTLDDFWDVPWDDAAIELCGAAGNLCTATACSPLHSLDLDEDSCQTIPAGKRDAPADLLCTAQRAGSADSEASCASAAVQHAESPLPDQVCLPEAQTPPCAEAPPIAAAAPTPPSSTAGPPPQATTHPAANNAPVHPASTPAAAAQPPRAAADPPPCQQLAAAQSAPAPAMPPTGAAPVGLAAAVPPTGAAAIGFAAAWPGPAAALGQRAVPSRPRPMATVLKVRKQQQAYHRRKKVKEAAVHAHAGVLKERLALLEADVSALLGRHEELTREQPWRQQHEEVIFMAGLAPLLPESIAGHSSSASSASASALLQSFMLEPTATVNALCKRHPRDLPNASQSHDNRKAQDSMQSKMKDPGSADTTNIAWSSILECLRLSRPQRDDISALYNKHLQQVADAHQICLAIASKVQVMPSINGKLTQCTWPNMAGCLVSSQLSSQAAKEADMVTSLTAACQKVLSPLQQRDLQVLAPKAVVEDLRALCREVSAVSCTTPRKAPSSSTAKPARHEAGPAKPAVQAPQAQQVATCDKTSARKVIEYLGEGSTAPQAAISHVAAAAAAAGNTAADVLAAGNDIIRALTLLPLRALCAVIETGRGAELGNAPFLLPTVAQPVNDDVHADMASMPNHTQLASLCGVEPAAPGNASAQVPAAAAVVVPACDVALDNAALEIVMAQLAAVPSEAALDCVIVRAQHKRQVARSPTKPRGARDGLDKRACSKAVASLEEAALQARGSNEEASAPDISDVTDVVDISSTMHPFWK